MRGEGESSQENKDSKFQIETLKLRGRIPSLLKFMTVDWLVAQNTQESRSSKYSVGWNDGSTTQGPEFFGKEILGIVAY